MACPSFSMFCFSTIPACATVPMSRSWGREICSPTAIPRDVALVVAGEAEPDTDSFFTKVDGRSRAHECAGLASVIFCPYQTAEPQALCLQGTGKLVRGATRGMCENECTYGSGRRIGERRMQFIQMPWSLKSPGDWGWSFVLQGHAALVTQRGSGPAVCLPALSATPASPFPPQKERRGVRRFQAIPFATGQFHARSLLRRRRVARHLASEAESSGVGASQRRGLVFSWFFFVGGGYWFWSCLKGKPKEKQIPLCVLQVFCFLV